MTKIYISGSWKNRNSVSNLMRDMENSGYEVIIDWTKHKITDDARHIVAENIEGLKKCDCLIYCMDGIRSRGKYFELGYATALEKPIGIYLLPTYYHNVYRPNSESEELPFSIIFDNESVFVRSKLYPILSTIDELENWISRLNEIYEHRPNNM